MNHRRHGHLVLVLLALTGFVPSQGRSQERTETRPNVILMMADDLGWGDPSFQGNRQLSTPHLDQMAADGATFERFYAAAPVCSPTRGSCLTGRHPFRYGIFSANAGRMLAEELTLAELLSDQGYATGHFGKWHLGTMTVAQRDSNRGRLGNDEDYSPPWEHGFDQVFATEAKVPTWDPLLKPKVDAGNRWWRPVSGSGDSAQYGTAYWTQQGQVDAELRGDDSTLVMDRAIDFMQPIAERGEQPFFVVIWFHTPHLPVVSGSPYVDSFEDLDGYPASYFGCISAMDEQIGHLREKLHQWGVAEDTLIAFCSDNGPEGNQRAPGSTGGLRGRKRSLYEGGIRVPGLMVYPRRIDAGTRITSPAVTSDYLPTVLKAAGVPPVRSRPFDGMSLWPLISDREQQREAAICFEAAGQLAIIDDRYKLIRPARSNNQRRVRADDRTPPVGEFELYDLTSDRAESSDVREQHPDIAQRLWEELSRWRKSCQDSRAGADY